MLSLDLQTVELKIADGVAWVILNRPDALNAWTEQLGQEMLAALEHAAERSARSARSCSPGLGAPSPPART